MNSERLSVPIFLRLRLLKLHHLYVTEGARICHEHLGTYYWDFLEIYGYISQFSPEQLEAAIKLALESAIKIRF